MNEAKFYGSILEGLGAATLIFAPELKEYIHTYVGGSALILLGLGMHTIGYGQEEALKRIGELEKKLLDKNK